MNGTWSGLKFYLHDQGAFNFNGIVQCFLDALGLDDLLIAIDRVTYPNISEHVTDILALRQLREHPGRVFDPALAQLHIVGSAIGASRFAANLPGAPCGGMEAHYNRVRAMFHEMQSNINFQNNERNWMLIETDWDLNTDVLPVDFQGYLGTVPMLLASVDIVLSALAGAPPNRTIVVPYTAHGLLDRSDDVASIKDIDDRKFSFLFHGDLHRKHEGEKRSIMLNITEGLEAVSIVEESFHDFNISAAAELTRNTTQAMRDSVFCLIPAGDTPSSRRLFDALAAGCVPIIFSDDAAVVSSLPFHHTIDWTRIAYFGGGLDCLIGNENLVKDWLDHLWRRRGEAQQKEMQRLGRAVFAETLSYRMGDLISPMLVEVERASR